MWDTSLSRLILKARQTGISQTCALEALHTAMCQEGALVVFVSRNLELAANLLSYVKNCLNATSFLDNFNNLRAQYSPDPKRARPIRVKRDNAKSVILSNGSVIRSVASTRSAGRGFAATAVYLDEAAFLLFGQQIYTAIEPMTARGGRLTILSTPNGRGDFFCDLWEGAEGQTFSRHTIPWHLCPEYWTDAERTAGILKEESAWYKDKRRKHSRQSFAQEYECDFADSGAACFTGDDIKRLFDEVQRRKALADAANHRALWREEHGLDPEGPPPDIDPRDTDDEYIRRRVTAWDIGRRKDATVRITLEIVPSARVPLRIIGYERHEGLPYPMIQKRIAVCAREIGGRHLVESNSPGSPVLENLPDPGVRVEGRATTAQSKPLYIEALMIAIESGHMSWDVPDIDITQLRYELLRYQWDDKNIVQDSVMALAIAVYETGHLGGLSIYAE